MPQTHNSKAEINQGIANGRLLSMMERRREVRTLNAGRMLSPDNYVQDPGYTQNYNRYSYAWNNPLVYEDPDGDFVLFAIGGALIGSYIGASIKGGTANPAQWNDDWWQGALVGAGIGAAVGAGVGAVWASGGSISIGASAGGQHVSLVSFSKASAGTGKAVSMTLGGGLWLGGLAQYHFGNEHNNELPPDPSPAWYSGHSNDLFVSSEGLNSKESKNDWNSMSDGQRIKYILNEIKQTRQAGGEYIDIRNMFDGYPVRGRGVELMSTFNMGDERFHVHMEIAIYKDMRIYAYQSRTGKVGPFDTKRKGVRKKVIGGINSTANIKVEGGE